MATNLLTRLERLEASAAVTKRGIAKVARIVVNQGEEDEAYRKAEEMGLDVSPESSDLLIIRLMVPSPNGPKWCGAAE